MTCRRSGSCRTLRAMSCWHLPRIATSRCIGSFWRVQVRVGAVHTSFILLMAGSNPERKPTQCLHLAHTVRKCSSTHGWSLGLDNSTIIRLPVIVAEKGNRTFTDTILFCFEPLCLEPGAMWRVMSSSCSVVMGWIRVRAVLCVFCRWIVFCWWLELFSCAARFHPMSGVPVVKGCGPLYDYIARLTSACERIGNDVESALKARPMDAWLAEVVCVGDKCSDLYGTEN